jgi:hypothetical protein
MVALGLARDQDEDDRLVEVAVEELRQPECCALLKMYDVYVVKQIADQNGSWSGHDPLICHYFESGSARANGLVSLGLNATPPPEFKCGE